MDPFHHPWERLDSTEVGRLLNADPDEGLTDEEAEQRRGKYGTNSFEKVQRTSIFENIARQFKNPIVFILLVALAVTILLHEYIDTFAISVALFINVLVGTLLEERASRAFEKLRTSQEHHAIALRAGKKKDIPAEDLVLGDLVYLESGSYVPADVRIIEAHDLSVNESVLTGEWLAVAKNADPLAKDTTIAERHNMAWMGTLVESGFGRAIVTATGRRTQLGEIAEGLLENDRTLTPLQKNLHGIARFLMTVVVAALVIIFLLGLVRGEPPQEMFLLAVAVAVATVPSGLPAALTVVLALGMEAILKRGGLVRSLLAGETLGVTTIILTDKTGTLTEAKMRLNALYTLSTTQASLTAESRPLESINHDEQLLLELAVLGTDAFIEGGAEAPQQLTVHGRPIEKAIIVGGFEAGLSQTALLESWPRIDALRFESERRFGASLHRHTEHKRHRLIITGAPELLLERMTHAYRDQKHEPLTDELRREYQSVFGHFARQGKRIISVGYKETDDAVLPKGEGSDVLVGGTFVGLLVFKDPVRADVPAAIAQVQGAGAQVVMLTGDTPETARAIALEAGVMKNEHELVMRGEEIDHLSDNELYVKIKEARVIARALPSHKLRIAHVLKNYGEVVAMTGDGINDAPALRAASIGVAVGSGTEVAKEASDLVLLDNSFSIIVAAIEEGRRILDNLKKIVAYLLSTSFSEITLLGASLLAGAPLPLVPAQILWANIIEEGLMSFSFAFESKDPDGMKRDPRVHESKSIITKDLKKLIMLVSTVTGTFLVALYFWLLSLELPIEEIRTIMFAGLTLDAIFFALSLKSFNRPLWHINPFSNKFLLFALLTSIGVLVISLYFPPLSRLLSLVPLSPFEQLLLVGIGIFNLMTIEVAKYFIFERRRSIQQKK